eukprot:scaffold11431_cov118-Isochrysis_galbana.AAC.13
MADEAARRAVVAERNEVNLRRNEAEYLDSCRELSASIDRLESAVVMFLGEVWQPQPASDCCSPATVFAQARRRGLEATSSARHSSASEPSCAGGRASRLGETDCGCVVHRGPGHVASAATVEPGQDPVGVSARGHTHT